MHLCAMGRHAEMYQDFISDAPHNNHLHLRLRRPAGSFAAKIMAFLQVHHITVTLTLTCSIILYYYNLPTPLKTWHFSHVPPCGNHTTAKNENNDTLSKNKKQQNTKKNTQTCNVCPCVPYTQKTLLHTLKLFRAHNNPPPAHKLCHGPTRRAQRPRLHPRSWCHNRPAPSTSPRRPASPATRRLRRRPTLQEASPGGQEGPRPQARPAQSRAGTSVE